jgi:hypothetical protein
MARCGESGGVILVSDTASRTGQRMDGSHFAIFFLEQRKDEGEHGSVILG